MQNENNLGANMARNGNPNGGAGEESTADGMGGSGDCGSVGGGLGGESMQEPLAWWWLMA